MRRYLKYVLVTVLSLFVLLNILVAVQAYSFTHYVETNREAALRDTKTGFSFNQKVKMFFCGIELPRPQTAKYPEKYEDFTICIDSSKYLKGWFLTTDSLKQGLVLAFHGYKDEKSCMLDEANEILKMGYDVAIIDFMGVGDSSGSETTIGYKEAQNVIETYEYFESKQEGHKIYLYGFSMGAAAILKALHDQPLDVDGIILGAPFSTLETTIGSRARLLGLPKQPIMWLFTFWIGIVNDFNAFSFEPIKYAESVTVPALVLCGENDQYISNEEITAIYDALKLTNDQKSLVIFENSIHESYLPKHKEQWIRVLNNFLNSKNH